MKLTFKRAGVLIAGWAFVLVGIAGLFLPVLQGVLFILIGLFILSSEYIWAHHLLEKIRLRFPRVASQLDHAKQKGAHWLRHIFGREDQSKDGQGPPRRD